MGEVQIYSRKTAKDYYQTGCQFLNAARRCFSDEQGNIIKDNELIQLPAPTTVNGAFACELFLKASLIKENKTIERIHEEDDNFRNNLCNGSLIISIRICGH